MQPAAGAPRRAQAINAALLLLVTVLLGWSAPPWPDGWDGLGFLRSITHFDLASFAPHPPGYPVYVALLKLAALLTPSPLAAADLVAVLSGSVALASLGAAVARLLGPGAAPRPIVGAVVACVASCPLVWRCASGAGSEAPALALLGVACWGLSCRSPRGAVLAGLMVGLGLGVRASWAPLYLPLLCFAPSGQRRRAALAAVLAGLSWAAPFVAIVGPRQLLALSQAHLVGHASRWGGTALTEPSRVRYLLRDVFVDGLGLDGDLLGLSIGFVGALCCGFALRAWRAASWRGARGACLALAPYLAWIAVGQNLRQEPRHALPLVVALALALFVAAARDRRARVPFLALFLLCATRTAGDAQARKAIAPPGQQLVDLVRTLPDSGTTAVFGGASVRFFEGTDVGAQGHSAGALGDALLALNRMDRLPSRLLVTGELEGLQDSPYPLEPFATLCRPPRIDRKDPTLEVYRVVAPFLEVP
jgi:hypothetical protein